MRLSTEPFTRLLLAALLLTIGGGRDALAQLPARTPPADPATRFRIAINHVEIDATVVDRRGQFVRGLDTNDFEILEDGQPQRLSTLTLVDIPPVSGTSGPAAPVGSGASSVLTNEGAGNARLYVLVLDDLGTDARRSARVRTLARQFINAYLQPGDIAAVITTGSVPGGDQDFTSQHELLSNAVERFVGSRVPSRASTLVQLGCFRL